MGLNNIRDDNEGGSFELVPAGVYKARCAVICDLGLKRGQYGANQKIYWAFELVESRNSEGKPFRIGEQMSTKFGKNNSGEPSRLRGRLENWRGRTYTDEEAKQGPDLSKIINQPCTLNVMHERDQEGKVWPRITALMPAKNDEVPQLSEAPIFFSWDQPGQEQQLPEWLAKKLGEFPSEHPAAETASMGGQPTGYAQPGHPPGQEPVLPDAAPAAISDDDWDDDVPFDLEAA